MGTKHGRNEINQITASRFFFDFFFVTDEVKQVMVEANGSLKVEILVKFVINSQMKAGLRIVEVARIEYWISNPL